MLNTNSQNFANNSWENAFYQITHNGVFIPSSTLIRRWFRDICYIGPRNKTNIYLADVYGLIVMLGFRDELNNQLDKHNSFHSRTEDLAYMLTLSPKLVRKTEDKLIELGLIEIKRLRGKKNIYRINAEELNKMFEELGYYYPID
ncbi:hypothetical protein [Ruminiclostridium papyrosolvens]|uniref:Uncharacterized protein n=1 Tax=Ruminiclostridium papyrosolvens C7 TaxID=1330534 RepID=U4QX06_9FIRM|nr:hypothetical protein [Ruminiclostridium papyrosolvens]EPR08083.1 hypothetical protein L323_18255 [Ruminiclostridium papyrosolvens C7]